MFCICSVRGKKNHLPNAARDFFFYGSLIINPNDVLFYFVFRSYLNTVAQNAGKKVIYQNETIKYN